MKRTILAVGDIIGQAGMTALFTLLPQLKRQYHADLTLVNGENAYAGFGMSPEQADIIFKAGADVITSGNHIWDQKDIIPYLDEQPHILRPANYPPGNPGHGSYVHHAGGLRYAVINVQGRQRMRPIDCPFRKATELINKLQQQADLFIIDFHAEDPQEKEALAYYLDGKATLLFGTHTHVQTADCRILARGMAYISDIGATGPADSIIGFDSTIGIKRNLTNLPLRNEVSSNPAVLQGIVVHFDDSVALRAVDIQTITVGM